MKRFVLLVREAAASARGQPIISVVTLAVIAAMVTAVMLTAGRTVSSERHVLGALDQAGTREITVHADSGLRSDVLGRINSLEGIQWAVAFSSASDATNTAVPNGPKVPVRTVYSTQLSGLGLPGGPGVPTDLAYASPNALSALGMTDRSGRITTTYGNTMGLSGTLEPPGYLNGLEPLVLVPESPNGPPHPVELLVIIVRKPDLVATVAAAVTSLLGVDDPSAVTVETSQNLADVRAVVKRQLGQSNRGLVFGVLATTVVLVAMVLQSMVGLRRKDFGRRRALGATRSLIVGLVLLQTALLAALGAAFGIVLSAALLTAWGTAYPGVRFSLGLVLLAMVAALAAAILPAVAASRREPIVELRVP